MARLAGIGGAAGLGSMVYALVPIGRLLGEETMLRDAHALPDWITPQLIATDASVDVVAGAAGAIVGLLPLLIGKDGGELVFGAVEAELDVRYGSRDGSACAEFSWEGSDDNSHASGRGWAALGTAGRLGGPIFIHKGDDSGFVAERE